MFPNTRVNSVSPAIKSPLRKHAYSNILRILPPKNENFQTKNSGSFHISAQNIDCGYLFLFFFFFFCCCFCVFYFFFFFFFFFFEGGGGVGVGWGCLHSCQNWSKCIITKTYLYNFDPLKPHFYIVKLGFTGVYIIFLISAQKHRLWVLVRTASRRRF